MSDWMTDDDAQIDIALASVDSHFRDKASRATSNALIGLGLMLRSRRTTRRERPPMQAFEYCECCDGYSERYQSTLMQRQFVGHQGLVHPEITSLTAQKSRRSHRFCCACREASSQSLKWITKKRNGADRGHVKFARLLSEDHRSTHFEPHAVLRHPRMHAGLEEELRGLWPWTARTMARFLSSKNGVAQSSTAARIRLLSERCDQQNEFVVGAIRSFLPSGQQLPDWLLERAADFAHVELCTVPHGDSSSLYLLGYGRRGVRRTRMRGVALADVMGHARHAFADLIAKLGITPRHSIEFEIPHLHTHFRAECEERHVDIETEARAARAVPPAFQQIVRAQRNTDATRRGHVRFYCQVERPFLYKRLAEHLHEAQP